MVAVELGSNAKVGRLTDAEFRCLVTGVWALAAKAPIRGYLLVGEHPAEPGDVARQAHCTIAVAKRTLTRARTLGLVELDEETGCERVHDWEHINPAPKSDPTAAERMRRYRSRLKERYGAVTDRNADRNDRNGDSALRGEVEVEEKHPPTPSGGVSDRPAPVKYDGRTVPQDDVDTACRLLEAFNSTANTRFGAWTGTGKPSPNLKQIIGAVLANPDVDESLWNSAVALELGRPDPYWHGAPHIGVVFGPKVTPVVLENARRNGQTQQRSDDFVARLNNRRSAA